MKKWNKPELLTLGVENTFEENCDCSVVGSTGDASPAHLIGHHCHKNWIGHIGGHGTNSSHNKSEGCTTHKNCCCYTAPSKPSTPPTQKPPIQLQS